jgi:PAS domain S-box-containing protein
MQVLDRIHDGFYALDRDWRFTIINRSAERYIGRPREAMLGKVLWEEFPQLLGTRLEEVYRTAVATQHDREVELLTPIYERWVQARVFPSPDGLSVYFVDLTARKQAEDAVRDSEARYRAMFEHTLDGVQLTAPDGTILESNPAACRMLQRTNDEIRAVGRAGIVDTSDPRLAVLLEQRRIHGNARGEVTFIRKDGTKFPAEVSSAVFTDAGNDIRTSLTFRDLTDAKRGEAALRILSEASAALQASLDLDTLLANFTALVVPAVGELALIDILDGAVIRRVVDRPSAGADPRIEILRANVPEHPTDRGVSHVLRTGEPELVPVVTDEWLTRVSRDEAHLAAARALKPASIVMVPMIARDKVLGVLTLMQLDPSRRFDEADLPLARGLADRAALAIDNARLYREAVEARSRRDEMLGIVSHDLRTPLNTIVLRAELLARHHPAARSEIESITTAVRHAERLVQDLLMITAIEAGKLPLQRHDEAIERLLAEVVDLHHSAADHRGLSLNLQCAPGLGRADLDRGRFVQAISNLVGNAIKFTPPGGRIDVRATRGPATIVIEVSDTGAGIPADQLPSLFDRFSRGRHGGDGVGLGLAITKGVVDAHGGQLAVHSEANAGTTFTITLPVRASAGPGE